MKLGLHVDTYSWPGGPAGLGPSMRNIAEAAEEVGFGRLSVPDHVWQTSQNGPERDPMLESYTTLGFLAGRTSTIELLALVSSVTYRAAGLLAKAVTTLDVLSSGRAYLGIGAGWNGEEAMGLGLDFGPTRERFARLEETLRIVLQMWPLPRILIGGAGERQTLRLVAKYADACNIYGGPDAPHKLRILREHCAEQGRAYEQIEKTAIARLDVDGADGVGQLLRRLEELRAMGFDSVLGPVRGVESLLPLEVLGDKVIPEISSW